MLPATDDAIEALLGATPYPADHAVCVLPPCNGVATVELIAVNAAMAGCEPAAFPLVIAALEAISEPEWNAFGLTTTTSSVFPMLLVNGPSRDDLGIDYRAGCMGGAAGRGSMTIGRAVSLCLRNIGGQRAGETTKTVFGQPARFGFCIGEWEERSPWPSLAERRGFTRRPGRRDRARRQGHVPPRRHPQRRRPRPPLPDRQEHRVPALQHVSSATPQNGEVVVAINPMWAERFGSAFPEIEDMQQFLRDNAWQPIDLWPAANQEILRDRGRVDRRGPGAPRRPVPEQIVPMVCGGLGSLHAIALPSFGESQMQSHLVVNG